MTNVGEEPLCQGFARMRMRMRMRMRIRDRMVVPDLLEMLEVWYLRDLLEMARNVVSQSSATLL